MPLVKGEIKLAEVAQGFRSGHDLPRRAVERQNVLGGVVKSLALKEATLIC